MSETTSGGEFRSGAHPAGGGSLSDRIRRLLPDGAIGSVTEGVDSLVRFRVIPGRSFERVVYARELGSRHVDLSVCERYQPRDDLTVVGATSVDGPEALADGLRTLVTNAEERENRPPWRETYEPVPPDWQLVVPGVSTGRLSAGCVLLGRLAAAAEVPLFMWQDDARDLILARNPPADQPVVWSVSPRDEWSAHLRSDFWGDVTSPYDKMALLQPLDPAARAAVLAARPEPDTRQARVRLPDADVCRPVPSPRPSVEEPPPGPEQAPGGPVPGP